MSSNKNQVVIYSPDAKRKENIFKIFLNIIRNVGSSRELILVLFKRDFLMAYKRSFIGIAWILISPVIGIVSWIFMNQTGVLNPGDVGIPYPAYVLISTSLWGLFIGFYNSSAGTLGAGAEFIMQVKYSHEALLFKQVAVHLANFTIAFILNILVLIIFGINPAGYIVLLPLLVLPMFFLGAAIGLIVSMVSVVASDLTNIFNILFGFVFYLTPIIYSSGSKSETLQKINEYNPLTYIVAGVRDLILFGRLDHLDRVLVVSFVSLILFILSLRLFYISEDRVVERMI